MKRCTGEMKLTQLTNIEAFLTTFEQMMVAYTIPEEHWAFLLAPQLTHSKMLSTVEARDFSLLKDDDISIETYRQRFRSQTKRHTKN